MTLLETILIAAAVGAAGVYLLWQWLRPRQKVPGCGSRACGCTVSRPDKLPSKAAPPDAKS
jgi:hypothetical protein